MPAAGWNVSVFVVGVNLFGFSHRAPSDSFGQVTAVLLALAIGLGPSWVKGLFIAPDEAPGFPPFVSASDMCRVDFLTPFASFCQKDREL